jgi:small redox-active disulfide protein 2
MMTLVQVLGTGCAKCAKLKEHADTAVSELGVDASVEKVEDIVEITKFGVMMTPALVVDGEVKVMGKVPSVDDIKGYLS